MTVLTTFLMVLLVVAPVAILMAVWRNRGVQREARSRTVDFRIDEFGVRRELADGREEGVDWSELTEVEVYRTETGPHGKAGGMLMLSGDATRGCLVPLDKLGTDGLMEGLSRLPGFDLGSLADAIGRPAPCQLVVWRRGS